MKRPLGIALVLFASLMALAAAVPDSVVTGPFNISFDLGLPKDAYTVTVEDPKEKESLGGDITTEYSIKIENNTGLIQKAAIGISDGIDGPALSPSELLPIARTTLFDMDMRNIETSERMIDGIKGSVAVGDGSISGIPLRIYQAMYYPYKGTFVVIFSGYPWEEGTLQLLKSIHIEKIGARAPNQ